MKPTSFIFDMDGVMIDSEPFWQHAQINILQKLGIQITAKDCEKYTMGKRIDLVAETWYDLYNLEIPPNKLADLILDQVAVNIIKNGQAMNGLIDLLTYLKKENYKIALATSSSWKIIEAVLHKLEVNKYFDVICSADDEEHGKPNPAVYISAMKQLKTTPNDCIILEDSVTGMIAAKASRATTIVLTQDIDHPQFYIANYKCSSLHNVIDYLQTT